jgi:hypothetical protein
VFVGESSLDSLPVVPEAGPGPIYRWSALRFESPRAFNVQELTRLGVVTAAERMHAKVRCRHGELAVTGLAREGLNLEGDPFLKIAVPHPGALSISSGRDRILDYERGHIVPPGEQAVFFRGPVRAALSAIAAAANLPPELTHAYLDAVRMLVHEMASHGRGGILVVSDDDWPELPEHSPYRMVPGPPVTELLTRLHAKELLERAPRGPKLDAGLGALQSGFSARAQILRSAFLTEAERTIEELGALTAIDGATLLGRGLGLVGFGIVLPVDRSVLVVEALDVEAQQVHPFDLEVRGTRHTAAALYAHDHPGSVVFVASQDGGVSCLLRRPSWQFVVLWRFGLAVKSSR